MRRLPGLSPPLELPLQTGLPPPHGRRVAVAFSGGRDSLALLHATCRAAQVLGLQVHALHVHHGLQAEADAWVRQARRRVDRWRRRGWPVTLQVTRLTGSPPRGQSVEAWAREGRREALWRMAHAAGASLLLLGQHRQDQAETVLLQVLRGGGAAGLAAMPARARRAGLVWARPWLAQPRAAIDHYVQHHRLKPVEDPSNADPRWARNAIRLQVWPVLNRAFPGAEASLALAAQRSADERAALTDWAESLRQGCAEADGALRAAAVSALPPASQRVLLRHWWRHRTGRGAPESLVCRLQLEWLGGAGERLRRPFDGPDGGASRHLQPLHPLHPLHPLQWPAVDGWQAVAWRGLLQARRVDAPVPPPTRQACSEPASELASESAMRSDVKPAMALARTQASVSAVPRHRAKRSELPAALAEPCEGFERRRWPDPADYRVPGWSGRLRVQAGKGRGLPIAPLANAVWRERAPGDRHQHAPASHPQRLKKAWQAAGVPAWAREAPVLALASQAPLQAPTLDGALPAPASPPPGPVLWVAGLGEDARPCGPQAPGPRRLLTWLQDQPLGAKRPG